MESPSAYIPIDRRWAAAQGRELPRRASGSVMLADISGFTPLTAALLKELGLRRGPEELTRQLNLVYDALIAEVHRYGGSVIGFSGDAITCWLDGDDGLRATACGLAMQEAMSQFASIQTPAGTTVSLGMKVAVAAGPVRRFLVGHPAIQYIDALAGATLDRMAAAEQQAGRGEVVVAPEVVAELGDKLHIAETREQAETGQRFAVVAGLNEAVPPTPWPTPEPELSDEQVRPWLLPPVYERLQSGQGRFLSEIRPAVALFMRFSDIDYDTDDLAEDKLDIYIKWVQSVLARYEGFLLQLTIGDKGCYLYAAFGAPIAHGDEPARAIAAALELQNPPLALDLTGPVQIGISQGRMRTGSYGGTARSTYGVLGDEVNMAARLMGKAERGQIIVSQRIAQAAAGNYLLQDLGQIKVKGKEEPIPVSLVLGHRRHAVLKPVDTFPTALVGRTAELDQMARVLAATAEGEGQILRLQGVAGIGKSHLVAEFAAGALSQGWRVEMGACQSTSQAIPYHPWRQVFRTLFGLLDELADDEDPAALASRQIEQVTTIVNRMNPDWLLRLPLLGDLLDLPIPDNATTAAFDPQLRQEALFTLAIDLVQYWAQAQPLLIVLEDVHWLDESSRELTLALARTITQAPVVLAVVHRPPPDRSRPMLPELKQLANYHFLDLDELSPDGVSALVTQRLSGQPSPLLLDLIQLQARGNPFFVEELSDTLYELGHLIQQEDGTWTLSEQVIDALREANSLRHDRAGQWELNPDVPLSQADLGLPDSIHGLVLARLDRLLEAHKLTLKVASVIGTMFQFQVLARSHPVGFDAGTLQRQVEEVERREFIRLETPSPQLAYIFRHNITRDVAYESLLERQQRALHRAVAEAMEQILPDAVEQLAYHYSRARVHDKTLFYLDIAARRAQREYANETALSYYRQALALEDRWQWRKGQVEVLHILGRREEERAALELLAALPDAAPFDVAYLWGQYHEAIADYPEAQVAMERAMAISRAEDHAVNEARSLAHLGLIARLPGDYERAKDRYQGALAIFEGEEDHSDMGTKVRIDALNGLGTTYRQQGEFDQAKTSYQQALTLSRQHNDLAGEAEALNSLGVTALYQRHFAEALEHYQQALEIRQTMGDRSGEGKSLYSLAMVALEMGDYGQARQYLLAALETLRATGDRWNEVNAYNSLGIMHQELGDLSTARAYLEQGLNLAQEIGDEEGQAYLLSNLGLVVRDLGQLESANRLLTDGLAIMRALDNEHQVSFFLSYLSTVSLQAGYFEQAIDQAHQALALRQKLDLELRTTDDLATLAAAHLAGGDLDQALEYAGQALAILDKCGGEGPEFPQRDYLVCSHILEAAGQRDRAQAALKSARNLVMGRAEKIIDPGLRRSFLEKVAINREILDSYQNRQQ